MSNKQSRKEISHDRIVETAASALRRNGFEGVGVADVMKQAGLTHGGFYAHFPSRDALLVEALKRAGESSAQSIAQSIEKRRSSGATPFAALVESYLTEKHLIAHETGYGCPVAGLGSEFVRQSPNIRAAGTERVEGLIKMVKQALPKPVKPGLAFVIAGTMAGALQLARTLGNTKDSRAYLSETRRFLLEHYDTD